MDSRTPALVALVIAVGSALGCSAGPSAHRAGQPTPSAHTAYESSDAPGAPGAYDQGGESEAAEAAEAAERPGLGTEFGEEVYSRVVHTSFERAATEPFAAIAVHYNDADGVAAQAEYRGAALAPIYATTPYGGISVALVDERGGPLVGFSAGGRTYVVGESGQRYLLRVSNMTDGRYEVVASVDGLDVVDGRGAAYGKRGYILQPHSTLTIDGFRTSEEAVAAFRFASVRDSYAARTGDDRNVGVIGFAFFAERGSAWTSDELARRESADPFPDRYSLPPP